jgi:Holliday junction resolvase
MTGGLAPAQKGRNFERLCKRALESQGWLVVKSGGSLGAADLVAFRGDHQPWFVQCKATSVPYLRPEEWGALWHMAMEVNACPVLAYRAGAGARGIVYLALMSPERGRLKNPPLARVDPH